MNQQKATIMVVTLLCCLLLGGVVLAAPSATSIDRWVISSGGGHAEVAPYTLNGTIGQAVVGGVSNAPYQLAAGYWGGMGAVAGREYTIYLPMLLRNLE